MLAIRKISKGALEKVYYMHEKDCDMITRCIRYIEGQVYAREFYGRAMRFRAVSKSEQDDLIEAVGRTTWAPSAGQSFRVELI